MVMTSTTRATSLQIVDAVVLASLSQRTRAKTQDFCANLNPGTTSAPKDCLLDFDYVCDTDIGDEVKVEFCIFDNEKEEKKTKCGDPFEFDDKDGRNSFESCGACVFGLD